MIINHLPVGGSNPFQDGAPLGPEVGGRAPGILSPGQKDGYCVINELYPDSRSYTIINPGPVCLGRVLIDNGALLEYNIQIPELRVPDGVGGISERAFQGLPVTSIVLPDSVQVIREGAFQRCDMLWSINLPEGLKRIDMRAFSGCSSLKSVALPSTLQYLGPDAFAYTGIREVVLPPSLATPAKANRQSCFEGVELERVVWPYSAEETLISWDPHTCGNWWPVLGLNFPARLQCDRIPLGAVREPLDNWAIRIAVDAIARSYERAPVPAYRLEECVSFLTEYLGRQEYEIFLLTPIFIRFMADRKVLRRRDAEWFLSRPELETLDRMALLNCIAGGGEQWTQELEEAYRDAFGEARQDAENGGNWR